MSIADLSRITLTYHNFQSQRIEVSRRRINAKPQVVFGGRQIPDPANMSIGHGRRLQASVLFLDICGFTQRPSETAAQQEEQVRVLSLFISEMIRIVGDYGGTVEKNTGDGLMAYFGQSSESGDARQRSVACSMSMFHASRYFINPIIAQSGIDEVRFRICIDFGWITVARLGAAQRFNHIVAVGTSANRTSKMLQHADADEILIGDAMLSGLPINWVESHVLAKTSASGWQYADGVGYTFWLFDGRWPVPQR